MDQPFDKRNDNPEAPDLEAPKSDDKYFGNTAKDNKAAEKKPAEKNSTEKKSAEKKSEEKKIAEKKSSTSSIRKQARLFLACLCFAGAVFAAVLTAGTLTGCKIDSILPSQTEAGKEQAASPPQPALQTGQADQAGGNLPEGDSGDAENTDEAVPGSGQGSAASSSEPLLTLPYGESDPAQKSSAHNWLCSDLVENNQKLGEYALTEDFHAAVNRDWLSTSSIPSGYVSYDTFAERQLEVDAELQNILESNVAFSDPYVAHCQKLVKDYYDMWLDWDARNAAGVEPLREIITPLMNVHSLEEMTAYLSDPDTTIRALPLSSTFTAANLNDADSIAVYISPPSLVFQDPKYYSSLDRNSWKYQPRYIYAAGYMLERLGYSENERDRILKDSYTFECEMASAMMTTEEHNAEDSTIRCNNPRTFAQLQEEQGNFPLTGMLEGAGLAGSKVFILQEPAWLERMNRLYTDRYLEKMKAYLLVSDVLQFMDLLDRDCYDRMMQVRNVLSGSSGQVDDRKAACDAVNNVLEMELGEVYAETYITEKTKGDITDLINECIEYYHTMLEGEEFLSENTKNEALKKLDNLTIRVARPDDTEEMEIALQSVAGSDTDEEILVGKNGKRILDFKGPEEGGSLVDARIAISEYDCLRMHDKVNQPVDRTEWIAAPQDVNAYYYPLDNSINIPAGILGGIFYSDTLSKEEKLGHIGIMIGHEISHAFDTSGRQYDEQGNLRNWWTEEDYRLFHARAQKLVDYYNGFEPISGYPVKGAMIDTEAIADLTGVKCMLRIAAQESGFDYDLFFRTLASNWRCLTSIETEAYCVEQDSHPLPYLRTNAVVVQFEEFHRTYGTREGDGMYLAPEYRLEVW